MEIKVLHKEEFRLPKPLLKMSINVSTCTFISVYLDLPWQFFFSNSPGIFMFWSLFILGANYFPRSVKCFSGLSSLVAHSSFIPPSHQTVMLALAHYTLYPGL